MLIHSNLSFNFFGRIEFHFYKVCSFHHKILFFICLASNYLIGKPRQKNRYNLTKLQTLLIIEMIYLNHFQSINKFFRILIFVHNSKSKKENKKLAICIPFPLFMKNNKLANKMKKNKYKLI